MSTGKGSEFEREFCKNLSNWWTDEERDDVFWRTDTSGARATTRAKAGKTTAGQHGDICATDRVGEPLTGLITFELKRGYKDSSIQDLLDRGLKSGVQEYSKWIHQAETAAAYEGSKGWMLLFKRDRRQPIFCMNYSFLEFFFRKGAANRDSITERLDVTVEDRTPEGKVVLRNLVLLPTPQWFQAFDKKALKKLGKKWNRKRRS